MMILRVCLIFFILYIANIYGQSIRTNVATYDPENYFRQWVYKEGGESPQDAIFGPITGVVIDKEESYAYMTCTTG
jgi:hypothetical protein